MKRNASKIIVLGVLLATAASSQPQPPRPNRPSRPTPGASLGGRPTPQPQAQPAPLQTPANLDSAPNVASQNNPPPQAQPQNQPQNNAAPANPGPAPRPPSEETYSSEIKLGDYVDLDDSIKNEMYGTIDFPNAELKDIIKAISRMASKNFILDRKIENRRITILSPEPVTKAEAYAAFLSALYMNDLTVVSMGKFLKVIESKSALQSNIRVFVGEYAPATEEIVTVLYTLKYLNADEIQRFLTDLVPRNGRISSYPNTNTLVMTDTGVNLKRIVAILKSIDVPGFDDQLESIPIRYASAKSIAQLIEEILDAQSGRSGPRTGNVRSAPQKTRGGGIITKIVPDERTNALVVLANGRGVEELKNLVRKLDNPDAAGGGNIHVYYCRNAVAEELATTINALVSGSQKPTSAGAGAGSPNANAPAPVNAARGGAGGEGVKFEGNIKVTSDKATNSLVVVASASDFGALKKVLHKLDLPRRQVYVEATIMEINVDASSAFGLSMNLAAPTLPRAGGFVPSVGGVGLTDIASPQTLTGIVAGFTAGKAYTFNIAGNQTTISTLTGLLRAIEEAGQGQILHQPQILTSDNQEAEIKVNNKIPTATNQTTVINGQSVSGQTISKEDVTISLKLTPQLGEKNNLVKLKVEQAIDSFQKTTDPAGQIALTQRKANTSVTVRDGDTVVVGGLQKTTIQDNRSKFPLLGDIPVFGWLFKGATNSDSRSNLILFLTPHIISEYNDLLKITGQKIDEREAVGKLAYDPKDGLRKEVQHYKQVNKENLERPQPKRYGFRPKDSEAEDEEEEGEAGAFIQPDTGGTATSEGPANPPQTLPSTNEMTVSAPEALQPAKPAEPPAESLQPGQALPEKKEEVPNETPPTAVPPASAR